MAPPGKTCRYMVWMLSTGLAVLVLFACQKPVSEYPPKNKTEAAILSLLVDFQTARNHRDLQGLLLLLHPDGQFTYACGIMVSKETLAARLPDFWQGVDHGKLGTMPLAHECLNGDYYTSGLLKDPEITLFGDKAHVKVWFTRRWWSSLLMYMTLTKEKGHWLITRTWWGPS